MCTIFTRLGSHWVELGLRDMADATPAAAAATPARGGRRGKRGSEQMSFGEDSSDASDVCPPRCASGDTLPLPIPANQSSLSTSHVIARGRRRKLQLASMTEEQKAIEAEARMVKNREIARNCRRRKKAKIGDLEARVVQHETTIGDQARRIASLHKLVAQLGGAVPPGL